MKRAMEKASICFTAGNLGAFVNSLVVWAFGALGIAAALGVGIAPKLSPAWLYPRLVWGGLWGLLFALPLLNRHPFYQGLFWSLGPTLVQLFIVFPVKAAKGPMGLELGMLTPLLVIFFNLIWGIVTAYFAAFCKGPGEMEK